MTVLDTPLVVHHSEFNYTKGGDLSICPYKVLCSKFAKFTLKNNQSSKSSNLIQFTAVLQLE